MKERNPVNDLPIFVKNSGLLIKFFENNFQKRFEYRNDDHFAFMILCFLVKQKEHLNSVLTLVNAGSYSDAMIISRNMVEGVGIILWISEDLQKRALQWRKYSLVTDYRLSLKKAKGDKSKIDKNIIDRSLNEGCDFLKECYKKSKIQLKNLPPDPFKNTWLFNDVGEEVKIYKFFGDENKVLYEIYSEMSDWAHWNVGRIGTRIERINSEVGFYSSPVKDGCFALSSAILSMHYIIEVANKHLNLKLDKKIKQLMKNFKNELGINT